MGVGRKFLNWYARLAPGYGKSKPPYEHVIQIGDPRLRKVCDPVPVEKIKTKEIQTVIKNLEYVLKKYNSFGMSAPQIGVNLRIFALRLTLEQIAKVPHSVAAVRNMEVVPFTVFINPQMKVLDYTKVTFMEGCESVQGYEAEVPRYKKVEIKGYNEQGEETTKVYEDWAARMAQHEFQHLEGKIYVDTMDKHTLTCICWEEVNMAKGKLKIPFSPH